MKAVLLAIGAALVVAALGPTVREVRLRMTDVRAARAFNAGDYSIALPLLESARRVHLNEPERLEVIEEQLAFCRAQLAPVSVSVKDDSDARRRPHPSPRHDEIRRLSIKELGNFEWSEGRVLPRDVVRLDGMRLRTSGFILPLQSAARMRTFPLVPSLLDCCFGQPPQPHHVLDVEGAPGAEAVYSDREVTVEGVLRVRTSRDATAQPVFRLLDARVHTEE